MLPTPLLRLRACTAPNHPPTSAPTHTPQDGKRAIMVMRPRGWHLWEHHVLVDGQAVPGARSGARVGGAAGAGAAGNPELPCALMHGVPAAAALRSRATRCE